MISQATTLRAKLTFILVSSSTQAVMLAWRCMLRWMCSQHKMTWCTRSLPACMILGLLHGFLDGIACNLLDFLRNGPQLRNDVFGGNVAVLKLICHPVNPLPCTGLHCGQLCLVISDRRLLTCPTLLGSCLKQLLQRVARRLHLCGVVCICMDICVCLYFCVSELNHIPRR